MSFALPIALALAALALPIIALYILKVRLRRIPVSTNLFWKQIYEEKPPRSIWQHFRHLLSLLLQLLLLLLLVLAVADPFFSWQALQARRIVLVIDNSASMRAEDVRPSRLDAARSAAIDLVNGLRFRDELAVVVAGATPEVIVGLSGHAPTLRDAIDSIQPTDNDTQLRSAIELGRKLIGDHPAGRVIVLTDGCVDADELPLARPETQVADEATNESPGAVREASKEEAAVVEFRLFATEAGNVGITQFQVRRSLSDPLGYEVLVSVKNASAAAISCRLELTLDDIPVDVLPLTLKPDELWTRSLEKTSLAGGQVKAELLQIAAASDDTATTPASEPRTSNDSDLNHLLTDDIAWALLPERMRQPVLLVTPGNLFLQKVFEANPLVDVTVVREFPEQWPVGTIVVLHGAVPAVLPTGSVFVVDPVDGCDLWDQGDVLENPIVTEQDKSSPLMTHIRLDNVVMPEARKLLFKSPVQSLATTLGGDFVYAAIQRDTGKCLVLNVSLDSSDLAFRTAFPIMVANALGWFAGQSGELQPALSTGEMTIRPLRSPVDDEAFDLRGPDQQTAMLVWKTDRTNPTDQAMQQAMLGPFDHAGLWTVTARRSTRAAEVDQILTAIAVNLASERESDLRPLASLKEQSSTPPAAARWFSRPIWFYLALVACGLTCVEWSLYQRRVIS